MNLPLSTLLVIGASMGSYHVGVLVAPVLNDRTRAYYLSDTPRPLSTPWLEDVKRNANLPRSTLPIWKETYNERPRLHLDLKQNELFVHPALLAHEESGVVAVVSSSPEGVVREIQRHHTVEETILASNLEEETAHVKALKAANRSVDVVLMEDNGASSSSLFLLSEWQSILADNDGILVLRLASREDLPVRVQELAAAGFARITDYSVRLDDRNVWGMRHAHYLVAFTDTSAVWHLNQALWDAQLRLRIKEEEEQPLFFDSTTMTLLEYPSKQSAIEYCQVWECPNPYHGFDPEKWNIPKESLYVSKSTAGEHSGRGVFTAVDVPKDSYLSMEVSAHPIRVHWKTTGILLRFDDLDDNPIYEYANDHVFPYLDGYGFHDFPWGELQYAVDSGLLTFVNHGCNGSSNAGLETNYTEFNVDPDNMPEEFASDNRFVYNPVLERAIAIDQVFDQNFKPLSRGDEIFDNYLPFGGDEFFAMNVESLRNECNGAFGLVEQTQNEAKRSAAVVDHAVPTTCSNANNRTNLCVDHHLGRGSIISATKVKTTEITP